MGCLTNFIGVRGCNNNTAPQTGLYIEDLPGMSVPKFSKVVDEDPNAEQYLKDRIEFALKDYAENIFAYLERQEPQCLPECSFHPEDYRAASMEEIGVKYTRNPTGLSRLKMRTILVRARSAGNITITVTDGVTTTSQAFDLVAGDNLINFEFTPQGNTVTIYAENTLEFSEIRCGVKIGCNICGSAQAFKVEGYLDGNSSSKAWGFIPDLCLECDMEKVTCQMLHHLKQGSLYYVGAALLEEYLTSTRLNYFTIHSQEWAQAKMEEWNAKAEHLYLSQLNGVERYIKRIDPNCFICKDSAYAYVRP